MVIACAPRDPFARLAVSGPVASVSVETTYSSALLSRELLDNIACFGDGLSDREGARLFTQRKLFLSGGSDSKRHFFGDFLCASKESYPLAAGQRKLWLSQKVTRWPQYSGSFGFPRKLPAGRRTAEAPAVPRRNSGSSAGGETETRPSRHQPAKRQNAGLSGHS